MTPEQAAVDAEPWNFCLDCNAPLIPCICRADCPGGMCSSMECCWNLNSPLSRMPITPKAGTP